MARVVCDVANWLNFEPFVFCSDDVVLIFVWLEVDDALGLSLHKGGGSFRHLEFLRGWKRRGRHRSPPAGSKASAVSVSFESRWERIEE